MQMPAFSTTNPYLLYALTVSGVAYLIKLRNITAYSSLPVLPRDEVTQFSLNDRDSSNSEPAAITSVAATAGCLAVGRIDGSVAYFQLGLLHHSTPGNRMSLFLARFYALFFYFVAHVDGSLSFFLLGFVNELRDDSGIGRLWGFMSRY
jgi:nuclear pore complex protein Nup160